MWLPSEKCLNTFSNGQAENVSFLWKEMSIKIDKKTTKNKYVNN